MHMWENICTLHQRGYTKKQLILRKIMYVGHNIPTRILEKKRLK